MKRIDLYNNGTNFITSLDLGDTFSTDFLKNLSDTYFLQHSGSKTCGKLIERLFSSFSLVTDDGKQVYADNSEIIGDPTYFNNYISKMVSDNYKDKWIAVQKALNVDYDLEKIETENKLDTPNLSTETKVNTDMTGTSESSAFDGYKGFGSQNYSDIATNQSKGTSNSQGSKTNNTSNTSETGNREIVTSRTGGNVDRRIQERLRLKQTRLIDIMITDLDKFLTIPYYSLDD